MNNNNNNNSQGDQTLDINKDTINIKESLCWLWLRHAWVGMCWWPQLSLWHRWRLRPEWSPCGLCTIRLDSWSQSSTLSHHQPDRMPATSEWLQILAPGGFVFTPFLRLWVLGGDELEEVPICSWRRGIWVRRWVLCTFSFTHLPSPASSCLCSSCLCSSCPWSHFLCLSYRVAFQKL